MCNKVQSVNQPRFLYITIVVVFFLFFVFVCSCLYFGRCKRLNLFWHCSSNIIGIDCWKAVIVTLLSWLVLISPAIVFAVYVTLYFLLIISGLSCFFVFVSLFCSWTVWKIASLSVLCRLKIHLLIETNQLWYIMWKGRLVSGTFVENEYDYHLDQPQHISDWLRHAQIVNFHESVLN